MTVFVCEDDVDILEIVELIMLGQGFDVTTFADSKGLESALEQNQPDLIIIDYWLREIKADKVITRLKANPKYSQIPIILISAINNLEEIAAKIPVNAVVKKPFDVVELETKALHLINS